MIKVRPVLKWAGNKYHCMEHLLDAFPKATRLIEPFAGSAAVFMNTDFPEYVLAENNPDLISLYRYLQQEGDSFISYCKDWFVAQHNTRDSYYQWRETFNQERDERIRAAVFLYLNRHGYNGLCRYNLKGIYNVPFGRYKKPYFPQHEMEIFNKKSQYATFHYGDFRQTFQLARSGDLIYCDPPYAPLKQNSNFSAYTGKKFTEADQIQLTQYAIEAAGRGITVVISNHDTAFTRHQYQDAEINSFQVCRLINCKTHKRLPVRELIAVFRP
jgi:DNA adenine methylase